MTILPISNVINVTVTTTPQGLQEKNVNSLALFTHESPSNLDPYGIYISAAQVAADYGTNSVTAQMANAIFGQVPNIRTGKGRLVIIPMEGAVSATNGDIQTTDISANLAALIAVDDGDITVTIDGTDYDLSGIDFTGATTLEDIAAILQTYLVNGVVTADATTITITSKTVGINSTVAFSAFAGGGTDLTDVSLLNTAAATATDGVDSSGETVLEAITRTSGAVGYVPVITSLWLEDDEIEAIATGIQAQDRMFLHQVCSTLDIAGVATTIQQATQTRTRILLYTPDQAEANLMKSAYAGRAFSTDFTGSNTSTTMNLKTLSGIVPDPGVTQTIYSNADAAGVDLYVNYDGLPAIYSTGGNDYFDNPYSDLALKFALETAGFNYLKQTNTKVPQTEPGMNGLKDAYAKIMQQFVRNGELAPGGWNSSETFGDPEVFVDNITQNGYYIYSLPIAQQNSTEREARIAPLVQIAAKRAGAIHSGNVIVLVND